MNLIYQLWQAQKNTIACVLYNTDAETIRWIPMSYFDDIFIIMMKRQIKTTCTLE